MKLLGLSVTLWILLAFTAGVIVGGMAVQRQHDEAAAQAERDTLYIGPLDMPTEEKMGREMKAMLEKTKVIGEEPAEQGDKTRAED